MEALNNLIAVLCDPAGKCSIHGSDEDRRIVDESLSALKAALAAPQPEPQPVKQESWITAARLVVEATPEQLPMAIDALRDLVEGAKP